MKNPNHWMWNEPFQPSFYNNQSVMGQEDPIQGASLAAIRMLYPLIGIPQYAADQFMKRAMPLLGGIKENVLFGQGTPGDSARKIRDAELMRSKQLQQLQ